MHWKIFTVFVSTLCLFSWMDTFMSDHRNRRRIAPGCGQGTFQMATAGNRPTNRSNKTGGSFTLEPSGKWHQIRSPIRKCCGPRVASECTCRPTTTTTTTIPRSWSRSWLRFTCQIYQFYLIYRLFFPCIIPTACFISKGSWKSARV